MEHGCRHVFPPDEGRFVTWKLNMVAVLCDHMDAMSASIAQRIEVQD